MRENIINPDDKDYYDNLYSIGLYPGAGAELITFDVYANNEQQALELVVAEVEMAKPNLLEDFDSIRDYVYVTYNGEFREWLEDKSGEEYSYDESWLEFAQDYLGYVYVDATEYGASQPYFIEGNNLSIQEINDLDESKQFSDSDIEAEIKKYLNQHSGIFTDDSAYDIAEIFTGIKDISKLPNDLVNRIKDILHTRFNVVGLDESKEIKTEANKDLDVNKIAKFLKNSVNDLINNEYTCSWYDLDDDVAIFVGWTDGYDPEDTDYIHSEDNPSYVIAAKIASNHEYMKTDLDWLVEPYYEDGEVWDTTVTLTPNSDFGVGADWFIRTYKDIRKALDKGELLLENKKEPKKELFNVNIDTGDILSGNNANLDLGGAGALLGMLASEESKECDNKLEEQVEQLKLSDSDIAYLKEMGHIDEDIPQIEEALNVTKYTVSDVEKEQDGTIIIPDEEDDVEITAQEAREILGDEVFLSGLSRSAFHWNSGRYNYDETKYVSFDSSKLFKENKKIDESLYSNNDRWKIADKIVDKYGVDKICDKLNMNYETEFGEISRLRKWLATMSESELKDYFPEFAKELNESKFMKKENDENIEDITWLLNEYDVVIVTKEYLGSEYYYKKLCTSVEEAERFNYSSDYWGDADTYQEENVNLMEQVERYVGKEVIADVDGETNKYKILGIVIDKQYNSVSHTNILGEEINDGLTESKDKKEEYYKMPDDEHIIWDSEINYYDDDYKESIKTNVYQDYLNDLEDDEEPEDFDDWYEGYILDNSYDDANYLIEDLEENILPHIKRQLNDNVLLLSGSYGSNYPDFRSSGAGGVLFEDGTEDFRNYMSGFDRVCITTQNGILGAICNDHDGTVSGQFYTLPEDKLELAKALGYEELGKEEYENGIANDDPNIAAYEDVETYLLDYMPDKFESDLYYGGIDARDLNEHIDLLVPVKDTISGYAPKDPDPNGTKTESKKLDEKFMEFPTEQEKDDYIKDNNLQKDIDYKDKGPTVIELLKENKEVKTENYSAEELKDLLNKDEILKVGQTEFMLENGKVLYYDPAFTTTWNFHPSMKTVDDLTKHLINLQNNNHKIIVEPKDVKEKSSEEIYKIARETKIKDWYKETFPNDEMGNEINPDVTFYDLFETLDNYKDVYELLGINTDSTIRERVFYGLDDILDEKHGYSYEQWLLGNKTESKEIKIETKSDIIDSLPDEYENHFNKLKDIYFKSDNLEIKRYNYDGQFVISVADRDENIPTFIMYKDNKVKVDKYPGWNSSKSKAIDIADDINKVIDEISKINYFESKSKKTESKVAEEIAEAHGVMGDVNKNIPFTDLDREQQFNKIFAYLTEAEYIFCLECGRDAAKEKDTLENATDMFDITKNELKSLLKDYPEKEQEINSAIEKFDDAENELVSAFENNNKNELIKKFDKMIDDTAYVKNESKEAITEGKPYIRNKETGKTLTKSDVREKYKEYLEQNGWTKEDVSYQEYLTAIDETQEWELVDPEDGFKWESKDIDGSDNTSDKEKYLAYERVRRSGITNMFDLSMVEQLSGLSKDDILYVMNNYEELNSKYADMLTEAKFKDKVAAIKKSLKKNDKRLSDKTAEASAEKIAGSMIKKETLLPQDEYDRIAQDVAAGKTINGSDLDKFLHDTEEIKIKEIKKKYNLNEQEASDLEDAISYYGYLSNEGVIFTTIDSLMDCFTDMDENKIENVTENTKKAFAEYVIMSNDLFVSTWDNEAVDRAKEILQESKRIMTEDNRNVIPRNWKKLTYKAKSDTNVDKVGDVIEVFKDKWDRPICKNTRTDKTAYVNWDIIRTPELAEIIDIEKEPITETMNGFISENSIAEQLFDDFREMEDIDAEAWNNGTKEQRIAMVKPKVEQFYNENKETILDNLDDFMELLEYWNYHTEYKLFSDIISDSSNISRKTEASEVTGRDTIELYTDILPIINMYQYEIYQTDLLGLKGDDVDSIQLEFAEPLITEQIKGVLPSAEVTFGEFEHPKYYRLFSDLNDVLNFTVTYDRAEYETLKEKALQDPEFETYLKEHYSSYDGFISFIADNIQDFNEQEDWKQWVSVISYYLPNNREQNYRDMLAYVSDKLYENYETIDEAVEYMKENIEDDNIELTKDAITNYIKNYYNDLDEGELDIVINGVLDDLNVTESKKVEDVEYITQKELDEIPDDYKSTVGDTIRNGWEGKEKLSKLYKDLGYDEDDPMILSASNKGTILKPVKIKKDDVGNKDIYVDDKSGLNNDLEENNAIVDEGLFGQSKAELDAIKQDSIEKGLYSENYKLKNKSFK